MHTGYYFYLWCPLTKIQYVISLRFYFNIKYLMQDVILADNCVKEEKYALQTSSVDTIQFFSRLME